MRACLMVSRAIILSCVLALPMGAAELTFDFSQFPDGQTPAGFTNLLAGGGQPADWKVILADVEPEFPPLSPQAPKFAKRAVLTQLNHDATSERFPMLAYEQEVFRDFKLTTRFRILGGRTEQMAGIAFRLKDEENFYVIRVSALGRNLKFYKVVTGIRANVIGSDMTITTNEWHELSIECRGNEILCTFDGQPALPALQDTSFSAGKIAFWTMSDSVCQFAEAKITYTPEIPLSQVLLKSALEKYSRLQGLKIYVLDKQGEGTHIVASHDESELGQPGGESELGAIRSGKIYYGKSKGRVDVVMPLRDRNGEPVAAVRVQMDSFFGQTQNNALARARPVVQYMQKQLATSQDVFR